MPTPAEFDATVATALAAVLTGVGVTSARMDSDLDFTHEPVPAGEARYQVQSYPLPPTTLQDSGAFYRPAILVVLLVAYKLDGPERDYTVPIMAGVIQTLTTPSWWVDPVSGLDGAHFLDKKPVGSNVARVGNVVSFTVVATVTINPP